MQDTHIIDGTILDNIKYVNRDITDEEIQDILKTETSRKDNKIKGWI